MIEAEQQGGYYVEKLADLYCEPYGLFSVYDTIW